MNFSIEEVKLITFQMETRDEDGVPLFDVSPPDTFWLDDPFIELRGGSKDTDKTEQRADDDTHVQVSVQTGTDKSVQTRTDKSGQTRRDKYGFEIEARRQRQKFGHIKWKTHSTYLRLKEVGCVRKKDLIMLVMKLRRPGESIRDNVRSMNGLIAFLEVIPFAQSSQQWEQLQNEKRK